MGPGRGGWAASWVVVSFAFALVGCGPADNNPGLMPDLARPPSTDVAMLGFSDGASFDFGAHAVGSSVDHTVTISNSGAHAAAGVALAALAAPFSFKGGAFPGSGGTCGVALDPAQTCTVVL